MKTMDEKGANTFPFHNLPPELKKTISKVIPVLFHISFWKKEKSVATLANRNIYDQTQNTQVSSPTVLQNWRLCWGIFFKWGYLRARSHLFAFMVCLVCFYILVLCLGLNPVP